MSSSVKWATQCLPSLSHRAALRILKDDNLGRGFASFGSGSHWRRQRGAPAPQRANTQVPQGIQQNAAYLPRFLGPQGLEGALVISRAGLPFLIPSASTGTHTSNLCTLLVLMNRLVSLSPASSPRDLAGGPWSQQRAPHR